MEVRDLEPRAVFGFFSEVCRVPRASGHEGRMIDYLKHFAACRGLACKTDDVGNVLISKGATRGMEGRKTVVVQSHMDMVCEKRGDVAFDFSCDAIRAEIDGEWLRAHGTTLGADDGIGVAMELALLDADDIVHGPIECVFTCDEETGLTGAFGMKRGFMSGSILLNLDSEDEGVLFVSCAGGATTRGEFDFERCDVPQGYFGVELSVRGLTGGHSGDDIDKKRANANKVLVRFLYEMLGKYEYYLCDIDGGGLHNAIPREARAVVAVRFADKECLCADWNVFAAEVEAEYRVTERGMRFDMRSVDEVDGDVSSGMCGEGLKRMIASLHAVVNGVVAMSQTIDLVETSSNFASIKHVGDRIVVVTSQRSSIGSARCDVSGMVRAALELGGARVDVCSVYPGWSMNPESAILMIAVSSYKRLFGKEPLVRGIHAGLECGLFSEKYPGLDMVSFGPTLRGVHSPDERLLISSVAKVWAHLKAILAEVPENDGERK